MDEKAENKEVEIEKLELEKLELEKQIERSKELNNISSRLLPCWSGYNSDILKTQTEDNTESYLNGFYLYPIREFCANSQLMVQKLFIKLLSIT